MIHLVLHFIVPLLVALAFYRSRWRNATVIMIATMIVDIDHVLANPIYDPNRCSKLRQWRSIWTRGIKHLALQSQILLTACDTNREWPLHEADKQRWEGCITGMVTRRHFESVGVW